MEHAVKKREKQPSPHHRGPRLCIVSARYRADADPTHGSQALTARAVAQALGSHQCRRSPPPPRRARHNKMSWELAALAPYITGKSKG